MDWRPYWYNSWISDGCKWPWKNTPNRPDLITENQTERFNIWKLPFFSPKGNTADNNKLQKESSCIVSDASQRNRRDKEADGAVCSIDISFSSSAPATTEKTVVRPTWPQDASLQWLLLKLRDEFQAVIADRNEELSPDSSLLLPGESHRRHHHQIRASFS